MRVTWSKGHSRVPAVGIAVIATSFMNLPFAYSVSLHDARSQTSPETSKAQIPSNTVLTDVAFSSLSRGYGLFTVLGSVMCSDRVGFTDDGGASFSLPISVAS